MTAVNRPRWIASAAASSAGHTCSRAGQRPDSGAGHACRVLTTASIPQGLCRRCVRTLSRRLRDVPGIESFQVDAEAALVRVRGDIEAADLQAAVASVSPVGPTRAPLLWGIDHQPISIDIR